MMQARMLSDQSSQRSQPICRMSDDVLKSPAHLHTGRISILLCSLLLSTLSRESDVDGKSSPKTVGITDGITQSLRTSYTHRYVNLMKREGQRYPRRAPAQRARRGQHVSGLCDISLHFS